MVVFTCRKTIPAPTPVIMRSSECLSSPRRTLQCVVNFRVPGCSILHRRCSILLATKSLVLCKADHCVRTEGLGGANELLLNHRSGPISYSQSAPSECPVSVASRRILLTGGAGFIGSHVAEALLRQGAELTIIDNLDDFYSPARKRSNLGDIRRVASYSLEEVDICDFERLHKLLVRSKPEVIIHLAARAGVRPSIEQPRLYEKVNVAGTLNLLELCREFHVARFIFGSSSSVYGATSRAPFSEDQVELRPLSPYAATKLAAEMLCYTYSHLFALPIVCLR